MVDIQKTEDFDDWFKRLRDIRARAKVIVQIERLAHGNAGDVKPVGEGVSEMRIHYGPGYRVYYKRTATTIIVLLCGGDKASQASDIRKALVLAAEL